MDDPDDLPHAGLRQQMTPDALQHDMLPPEPHQLAASATRELTPLVGRQQEVDLLYERWQRVRKGHGQVVLLRGEPGIGKSRLMHVLKEQIATDAHILLECRCSPFHQHSALYPVIDLYQRILGVQMGWQPEDNLRTLEEALSQYGVDLETSVPLLATLLSLPLPADRYSSPTLSPQGYKQRTLALLLQLLSNMTHTQPVCLLIEDMHWIGPSTLELLTVLLAQVPTMHVFILGAYRPEFQVPWEIGSYVTEQTLTRLSPQDVKRMLKLLAGGKSLPPTISEQLLHKTDGVPLFIDSESTPCSPNVKY